MTIPAGIAKPLIRWGIAQQLPNVRRLLGSGLPFLKYYSRRVLASPNESLTATLLPGTPLAAPADLRPIDLSRATPAIPPSCRYRLQSAHLLEQDYLASNFDRSIDYPPLRGMPTLRQALAQKLHEQNQIHIDPEQELLIVHGVSQGIGLILDTFTDRGDTIALMEPGFFLYRVAAEHRELRIASIPVRNETGELILPEKNLRAALRHAKLLFLNSPHNPTGGILTAETVEKILWWCKRFDVLIFSDEVYEWFSYLQPHRCLATFPASANRLISGFSFSKTYGLSGLRVGYLVGARHLLKPMLVTALASAPFVSSCAQQAALLALATPTDELYQIQFHHWQQGEFLRRNCTALNLPTSPAGGAFYLWLSLAHSGWTSPALASALWSQQALKVTPGDLYHTSRHPWLRLSFTGDPADLQIGISRLQQFFEQLDTHSTKSTTSTCQAAPITPIPDLKQAA